jgi:siroheme synthase-like protein
MMPLLPIFLKLDGRPCLLVGAGNVALDKIGSLLKTGVKLRVVAPQAHPEIRSSPPKASSNGSSANFALRSRRQLHRHRRHRFARSQRRRLSGCRRARHPCNSVDDIPNCDFFFGSVVSRGDLQIAISTAGESPAVAQTCAAKSTSNSRRSRPLA